MTYVEKIYKFISKCLPDRFIILYIMNTLASCMKHINVKSTKLHLSSVKCIKQAIIERKISITILQIKTIEFN